VNGTLIDAEHVGADRADLARLNAVKENTAPMVSDKYCKQTT
jgi:hypothetical protein